MIAAYLILDKSGSFYDAHFMNGVMLVTIQVDPICRRKNISRYQFFRDTIDHWAIKSEEEPEFLPDLVGITESKAMKIIHNPMTYTPKPKRSPDWAVDFVLLVDRNQEKIFIYRDGDWKPYETGEHQ
jgi:hypothetical protein